MFEQATISLWSNLESLIKDFIARWLLNVEEAKRVEQVMKLKVKVGEYDALEPLEKCLWLVDLLEQSLSAPLKSGAVRFEALLEPFGLSGELSDEVGKKIFELSKIRNVLVHRNAIADRQLVSACPWLGYKLGDKVIVSQAQWIHFQHAVNEYVLEIIQRTRIKFGLGRFHAKSEK